MYRYKDIRLSISPQVFHPGFFFSTKLLLKYINTLPLYEKHFLELGSGSGLISIAAAKKNAKVTALEINPVAIAFLKKNCSINNVKMDIIESDLFSNMPEKQFDIIAINPPYYKKKPVTAIDHAWYCGEKGEYFSTLFHELHEFIHKDTEILMVLFEGCDMDMILGYASKNGYTLNCVHHKKNMLENNFIFKIEQKK